MKGRPIPSPYVGGPKRGRKLELVGGRFERIIRHRPMTKNARWRFLRQSDGRKCRYVR